MDLYATPDDVQARFWRDLTDWELETASALLEDASFRVRRRFKTVPSRIASGELDVREVRGVVAGMVKRAMVGPEGVSQEGEAAGPFNSSRTYANPLGNLFFTSDDVAVLAPDGRGAVRSVRLTKGA